MLVTNEELFRMSSEWRVINKTAASQSKAPTVMEITKHPTILAQVDSKLFWIVSLSIRLPLPNLRLPGIS